MKLNLDEFVRFIVSMLNDLLILKMLQIPFKTNKHFIFPGFIHSYGFFLGT